MYQFNLNEITHTFKGREDVAKLTSAQRLEVYNKIKGLATKKFSGLEKGIEQTWQAIQTLPSSELSVVIEQPQIVEDTPTPTVVELQEKEPIPAAKKADKKKRGVRFRFAPKEQKEVRAHRDGTSRAKAFALMNTENGATLSEIEKATGWTDPRDLYEGVRLIHFFLGHGLWHDIDKETGAMRVRVVDDPKEYARLVNESKKERDAA